MSEILRILVQERGIGKSEALGIVGSMPVLVVSFDFIKGKWVEADRLMGQRDKSDVPLVALALTIENHDGIWSTDKDFDVVKGRFKVWKTRELINL